MYFICICFYFHAVPFHQHLPRDLQVNFYRSASNRCDHCDRCNDWERRNSQLLAVAALAATVAHFFFFYFNSKYSACSRQMLQSTSKDKKMFGVWSQQDINCCTKQTLELLRGFSCELLSPFSRKSLVCLWLAWPLNGHVYTGSPSLGIVSGSLQWPLHTCKRIIVIPPLLSTSFAKQAEAST